MIFPPGTEEASPPPAESLTVEQVRSALSQWFAAPRYGRHRILLEDAALIAYHRRQTQPRGQAESHPNDAENAVEIGNRRRSNQVLLGESLCAVLLIVAILSKCSSPCAEPDLPERCQDEEGN